MSDPAVQASHLGKAFGTRQVLDDLSFEVAPGDVIVRFGDRPIEEPDDVAALTLELEPGTRVPVEVQRNGKRQTMDITLGTRPPLRRAREGR
jgi:S1-C subfamily serine protease